MNRPVTAIKFIFFIRTFELLIAVMILSTNVNEIASIINVKP